MNEDSLAAFLLQSEPWKERAACHGMDVNLFILKQGYTGTEAGKICATCPVREECDEYGERTHSVGIWGGNLRSIRYSEPVEIMPLTWLQDARPIRVSLAPRTGVPSILGLGAIKKIEEKIAEVIIEMAQALEEQDGTEDSFGVGGA